MISRGIPTVHKMFINSKKRNIFLPNTCGSVKNKSLKSVEHIFRKDKCRKEIREKGTQQRKRTLAFKRARQIQR